MFQIIVPALEYSVILWLHLMEDQFMWSLTTGQVAPRGESRTLKAKHMAMKRTVVKVLSVLGIVLVWFPIAAPVLLAVVQLISRGKFLFDYFMPIELFYAALVGGVLLVVISVWARSGWRLISLGFGIAAVMRVTLIVIGTISDELSNAGVWTVLSSASIIDCSIGMIIMGIGGVLLYRETHKLQSNTVI